MIIKRFTVTVKEWAGKKMWIRRWLSKADLKEREISIYGTGPTVVADFGDGIDLGTKWGLEVNCEDGKPLVFINNVLSNLNGHTCAESIGDEVDEFNYKIEIELAKPIDQISFEGCIEDYESKDE